MSALNPRDAARSMSGHTRQPAYPCKRVVPVKAKRVFAGTAFLHPIASLHGSQTTSLANLSGEDAAQRNHPHRALGGKHHSVVLA